MGLTRKASQNYGYRFIKRADDEEFDLDPDWSKTPVLTPPNCSVSIGAVKQRNGLLRRTPESAVRAEECLRRTHNNLNTVRAYKEFGTPLVYRNAEDRRSSGWR